MECIESCEFLSRVGTWLGGEELFHSPLRTFYSTPPSRTPFCVDDIARVPIAKSSFEWLHLLVAVHHLECFSVIHYLMIDFDQHLAITTYGSGPTASERELNDASLSAISLPLVPMCPGTHKAPRLGPRAQRFSPTLRGIQREAQIPKPEPNHAL